LNNCHAFSATFSHVPTCINFVTLACTAAGFVITATVPVQLLVVHEVIVEGSGTAFVISVSSSSSSSSSGGIQGSSSAGDRHLHVPVGHVHTQGYFHKYVAFASFDAAETRFVRT